MLFQFFRNRIKEFKKYVIIYIGIALFSYSFVFILNSEIYCFYLLSVSMLSTFILLANLWNHRYFGEPLSKYSILQLNNLRGLGSSIMKQVKFFDIIFLLDLFVIVYLLEKDFVYVKNVKSFTIFISFSIPLLLSKSIWDFINGRSIQASFKFIDRNNHISVWSPVGYAFLELISFFLKKKNHVTPSEVKSASNWFDKTKVKSQKYIDKQTADKDTLQGFGIDKNLILIQVESLENFIIGSEIDNQEITPKINAILKNSIYFNNIYAQTGNGHSSDAELIINSSMYPVKEGSTFFRFPNTEYQSSFPNLLKSKGYNTFAVHGDIESYWNRQQAYPGIGIDKLYGTSSLIQEELLGMGLSDKSFFRQSLEILKIQTKPFYSYLITLTSHIPFKIPEKYKKLKIKDNNERLFTDYLQSIHYTDSAIGEFIEGLSEANLLENSILVIFGDHQAIDIQSKQRIKENIKLDWIEPNNKVPFIIYNPQIVGRIINKIGGQIDIHPTLSYLMDFTPDHVMGKNLFACEKEFAVLYNGEIITNNECNIEDEEIASEIEKLNISDILIRINFFNRT
jgi:lipoteichoic acid synthase